MSQFVLCVASTCSETAYTAQLRLADWSNGRDKNLAKNRWNFLPTVSTHHFDEAYNKQRPARHRRRSYVVWGRSEEAPRTEKSETFLIMKDSEFG